MVNRADKKTKHCRWRFYFPEKAQVKKWKSVLRQVAEARRTTVTVHDDAPRKVDLVWEKAVAYDTVARLVALAQQFDKKSKS